MQVEGTAAPAEEAPAAEPETDASPEATPVEAPAPPVEEPPSPEATPAPAPAAAPAAAPVSAEDLVRETLTKAGHDPEEFLAPRVALTEEQQQWGSNWEIRDLARTASNALVAGSFEEKLDALEAVSGPGTFQFIDDILVAQGAEHVAFEHGISPQELVRRIGPPAPVPIPRAVERVLEQLPPEEAKVLTDVIAQRDEFQRRLDDAVGVARQAQAKVVEVMRSTTANAFGQEFNAWHHGAIGRLADVPPEAVESVMLVTTQKLLADPAANKALDAYAAATERGENPRVLRATFLPPVLAAVEALVKHELYAVRGYKPKPGAENGSKAKPAGTPSKVINPTKAADAAATAKTKAQEAERGIPTSAEVADAYMADLAKQKAAKQKGA